MGIRSVFRRLTGKPPASFDEIRTMMTRELPSPDMDNKRTHIQFIAEKGRDERWTLYLKSNSSSPAELTSEFQLSSLAVWAALMKHVGKDKVLKLNFDSAFLVLRELEEAHLNYNGQPAESPEPSRHYMVAYRLLPQKFQEGLDDLYQTRRAKGDIMPRSRPAAKQPEGPKL